MDIHRPDPPPISVSQLTTDINGLTVDTKYVAKSLSEITDGLLSAKHIAESQQVVLHRIEDLLKKWYDRRDKTAGLIYTSVTIAGDASDTLKVYVSDVLTPLQDEKKSLDVKRDILDKYIKTLKDDQKREEDLSQGFVDANKELPAFLGDVQIALSDDFYSATLDKHDQIVAKINPISRHMGEMYEELEKLQEPQDNKRIQELSEQIEQTEKTLHGMSQEAKEIEYAFERASNARGLLRTIKTNLEDVGLRMGRFANIWATLKNDTLQLRNILKDSRDDIEVQPLLEERLKSSMTDYTKLRDALQRYLLALKDVK